MLLPRIGNKPSLSSQYIVTDNPSCLRLFTQEILRAASLAPLKAGRSMPARTAIIAMTTNSSIKVKAAFGAGAFATKYFSLVILHC